MNRTTVCLCAETLYYPEGGGHLWVYLNWALGLQSNNCRVIWLEPVGSDTPPDELQQKLTVLKRNLKPTGLDDHIALISWTDEPLTADATRGCLAIDEATSADLLVNIQKDLTPRTVKEFRRSVFLDIDPGLLQLWVSKGQVKLAPHDFYFTIGETVGRQDAGFPDLGLEWFYTPPCVALDWWPAIRSSHESPFTTVVHWYANGWMDDTQVDDKRSGFLPYLDLPKLVIQPLELATDLGPDADEWVAAEKATLQRQGWRLQKPSVIASNPWNYRQYIQTSRAEFSCAKPAYIRLQNAWISDRTICYLASGKPAVVEHTGASRFLPDAGGLFRFRNKPEAVRHIETVAMDYERQCNLARSLAEEYFDARKVARAMLERAL